MTQKLSAVILAAGMGTRLRTVVGECPKGLLPMDGKPLIKHSLDRLKKYNIEEVIIVTGYMSDQYHQALSTEYPNVKFIQNEDFDKTGSMHSLYLTKDLIHQDFLLLESDLFYENRCISTLTEKKNSTILLSGKTNSGDEVYVYGENGSIAHISKKIRNDMISQGELVGISRISTNLFKDMCHHYNTEVPFPSDFHYEDCISDLSVKQKIAYYKVDDLLWAEIDDPDHYDRVINFVLPEIKKREG